ncbi:alpha-L-rhamnosidase-related protein [Streptomyces sp. HG99]|uniref:alpha-L-rhamnosidase n=1 Tax=Streptomyces dengpaensis TaxID=2049881 RepID=A0ABM6T243_9ACTN|nr:hypothetical protein C4B68_03605 [Streptomyces dengpaensis]
MAGGAGTGGTAWAAPAAADRTSLSGLTVEHRTNPLGVDADKPRFGWRMVSAARGRRQTAYQILVATSPERLTRSRANVWNSGRVESPDSVAVRYSGTPLRASTRYSAQLMAQMARATGRTTEAGKYDRLFAAIKRAFITKYLSTSGGKVTVRSSLGGSPINGTAPEDDSQTALVWVLKLGLYDTDAQRRQIVDLLAENIGNDAAYKAAHPDSTRVRYAENTLSVGFLGVNVLAPVLTDQGRADLAYKLLLQDAMPSWLYSVKNGATTIWERWNSYSKEDGFGPVEMNSFNHYSYGAIMEWMYEDMAGIAKDPAHPGFRHFLLKPHVDPTGTITHVAASHGSPYGEIVSEWTLRDRTLTYRAVVPANSEATLRLPAIDPSTVRAGRTPLAEVPGVEFLGFDDAVASYRLPSGGYEVTSALG